MQTTEQRMLQTRADEMARAAQIAAQHHDLVFAKELSQYAQQLQTQVTALASRAG
jgi:hypothetical protein